MRINQNKLVKRFAFVTNSAYESIEFIKTRWHSTASVGDNYKVVNYLKSEEEDLKRLTESLGFKVKDLDCDSTIASMNSIESGPFICSHNDAISIIGHFNNDGGI